MRDSRRSFWCQGEILDGCGKTVDNLWKSTGMGDGRVVEGGLKEG